MCQNCWSVLLWIWLFSPEGAISSRSRLPRMISNIQCVCLSMSVCLSVRPVNIGGGSFIRVGHGACVCIDGRRGLFCNSGGGGLLHVGGIQQFQLVNNFAVTSIHYCNSLLVWHCGLSARTVQLMLNYVARLVYGRGKYDYVNPLLDAKLCIDKHQDTSPTSASEFLFLQFWTSLAYPLTFGWNSSKQTDRSTASQQICWTFFFSVWLGRMELITGLCQVINICWHYQDEILV